MFIRIKNSLVNLNNIKSIEKATMEGTKFDKSKSIICINYFESIDETPLIFDFSDEAVRDMEFYYIETAIENFYSQKRD